MTLGIVLQHLALSDLPPENLNGFGSCDGCESEKPYVLGGEFSLGDLEPALQTRELTKSCRSCRSGGLAGIEGALLSAASAGAAQSRRSGASASQSAAMAKKTAKTAYDLLFCPVDFTPPGDEAFTPPGGWDAPFQGAFSPQTQTAPGPWNPSYAPQIAPLQQSNSTGGSTSTFSPDAAKPWIEQARDTVADAQGKSLAPVSTIPSAPTAALVGTGLPELAAKVAAGGFVGGKIGEKAQAVQDQFLQDVAKLAALEKAEASTNDPEKIASYRNQKSKVGVALVEGRARIERFRLASVLSTAGAIWKKESEASKSVADSQGLKKLAADATNQAAEILSTPFSSPALTDAVNAMKENVDDRAVIFSTGSPQLYKGIPGVNPPQSRVTSGRVEGAEDFVIPFSTPNQNSAATVSTLGGLGGLNGAMDYLKEKAKTGGTAVLVSTAKDAQSGAKGLIAAGVDKVLGTGASTSAKTYPDQPWTGGVTGKVGVDVPFRRISPSDGHDRQARMTAAENSIWKSFLSAQIVLNQYRDRGKEGPDGPIVAPSAAYVAAAQSSFDKAMAAGAALDKAGGTSTTVKVTDAQLAKRNEHGIPGSAEYRAWQASQGIVPGGGSGSDAGGGFFDFSDGVPWVPIGIGAAALVGVAIYLRSRNASPRSTPVKVVGVDGYYDRRLGRGRKVSRRSSRTRR